MVVKLSIVHDTLHEPKKTDETKDTTWWSCWSSIRGTDIKLKVEQSIPNIIRITQYYWHMRDKKWIKKGEKDIFVLLSTDTYCPKSVASYCPPKVRGSRTVHYGYYLFRAAQQLPPFEKSKWLLLTCRCKEPECGHTECGQPECGTC